MRFRYIEKRVSSMAGDGFLNLLGYVELEDQTDESGLEASTAVLRGGVDALVDSQSEE